MRDTYLKVTGVIQETNNFIKYHSHQISKVNHCRVEHNLNTILYQQKKKKTEGKGEYKMPYTHDHIYL